jgi:seryl-tRNA synthetase
MLDVNLIRKNPALVKDGALKKNIDVKLVDKFLRFDEAWRKKIAALDHLKSEQNTLNKELARNQTKDLLSRAQLLKKRIVEIETESEELNQKRKEILFQLPNLPDDDVPVGPDEKANKVIKESGLKPQFNFKPKSYLDLAENLGIIDVKKAAAVSGSRFGYLLGEAVLLEFGLVNLAFDLLTQENFIPIIPPVMIKKEPFQGMGRLSPGQEEERYYIPKDNLYLVGSAEHSIGPFHMNDVIDEKDLPKRYVGFSTCFRREAGSYGKDTKGILRVHQFDKVEMFSFSLPENSRREHEYLLSLQEKLVQKLDLPYRVVLISTGDMGFTDAKQYDIEIWLPGQGEYRETHSCSNTTDFQARGINAKYKTKDGKKDYLHMLNATAFAIGRMIIAIIENYQTKEGTILVPAALQKYVGKKEITRPKNTL